MSHERSLFATVLVLVSAPTFVGAAVPQNLPAAPPMAPDRTVVQRLSPERRPAPRTAVPVAPALDPQMLRVAGIPSIARPVPPGVRPPGPKGE